MSGQKMSPLGVQKTVLVVEDEPGLRFLIADVLREDGGFNVIEAESGDEALKYLRSDVFIDCVFTDVRMPGTCDGIELARFVRSNYPEVKIIMTSGNLGVAERVEQVPFMPKPYDVIKVMDEISQILH